MVVKVAVVNEESLSKVCLPGVRVRRISNRSCDLCEIVVRSVIGDGVREMARRIVGSVKDIN